MADAKLKLEHKIFEIEVNNSGDTITIDPTEIEFPLRFQKCYEKINKIQKDMDAQRLIISKKEDVQGDILSKNQEETLKMLNEKYNLMRKAIDDLFGEGSSMKIFGKHNWSTMFAEFFYAIAPIMEEAGVSAQATYDSIRAKYAKVKSDDKEL